MGYGLRIQTNGRQIKATSLPAKGRKPGKGRMKKRCIKKKQA